MKRPIALTALATIPIVTACNCGSGQQLVTRPDASAGSSVEIVDARPDQEGTSDAGAEAASPTSWCEALFDGGPHVYYCADFDKYSEIRTANVEPQVTASASLEVVDAGGVGAIGALLAALPQSILTDAAAPEAGAYDLVQSRAQLLGFDEQPFRSATLEFAIRNDAVTSWQGSPIQLAGAQFGWLDVTVQGAPNGNSIALTVLVKSFWKGPVEDAADLGARDDFIAELPASSPPLAPSEWVTCLLTTKFDPQPAGDAKAHVELVLVRNGNRNVAVAYDHPSTRYRYTITWVVGPRVQAPSLPLQFTFDNVAFYEP